MASEAEFWGRPFAPGPVRVDPDAIAARARIVREALIAVAADDPDVRVQLGLETMAEMASDETLAKLGRLLK